MSSLLISAGAMGLRTKATAPAGLSARSTGFAGARTLRCAAPRAVSARPQRLEVQAKGKKQGRASGNLNARQQQELQLPPIDPEKSQFVLFARSKAGFKRWFPVNVFTSGTQGEGIVKAIQAGGAESSKSLLLRQMALSIYKDRAQLESSLSTNPQLKHITEFAYGMCILDRNNPRLSISGTGEVWELPSEEEVGDATPLDAVTAGAAGVVDSVTTGWNSFAKSVEAALPKAG